MSEIKRTKLNILCVLLILVNGFCVPPTDAQSETVQGVFESHGVVPDVIPAAPNQFLEVTYRDDLLASRGVELTPTQVQAQPQVKWNSEVDTYYTLIMTDPDAPSRADPKFREFNHWLVGNIPRNDVAKGEVITAYIGSGPPQGTGLHRYVFLLYKQPGKLEFDEERVGNNSRQNRPKFSALKFAQKYNLDLIAADFYQAQWDEYVPTVHQQLSGK